MKSLLNGEGQQIDRNLIEKAINTYYQSTGISVFSIDEHGKTVLSFGINTSLCCYLLNGSDNKNACSQAHLFASKQAMKLGDSYIFFCPAGLVHFSAPIVKDNVFKGAIMGGPILMDYPDEILVDEIMKKYRLPIDNRGRILSYLKSVPVVEPSRVTHLSRLLFILAMNIIKEDSYELHERNAMLSQQAKIGEKIKSIKDGEGELVNYPYELEKELTIKVRNGDIIGSKSLMNELLGYIFFMSGGNIEVIKARILELCTLLSRAAVEGGAELDKIFGMNYEFINELSKIKDIDELSYWTIKVLDGFGENIFNTGNFKNVELMKKAISYINDNYANNITLDSVAGCIHLNSSYFSTLFKKETGMGFSDYLNRIRIEKSKYLLKNINYSVLDAALAVGFEDQSYYSKVFKKITGSTPKEFRETGNRLNKL